MCALDGHAPGDAEKSFPDAPGLRIFRRLLEQGKPTDPVTVLMAKPDLNLAAFTLTGKDRLLFFPPFPAGMMAAATGGPARAFDHVTLELPRGRVHFTRVDGSHEDSGFLQCGAANEARFWLAMAAPWHVFDRHTETHSGHVLMPNADKGRRIDVFGQVAAATKTVVIPLPPEGERLDMLWMGLYLAERGRTTLPVPLQLVPGAARAEADAIVMTDGTRCSVSTSRVTVGSVSVALAVACLPDTDPPQVDDLWLGTCLDPSGPDT